MDRRRRTPEEIERREKLYEVMQAAQVGEVSDLKTLFKDMISVFIEKGLDAELEETLGYGKYDYRNKNTDNSRNGYSEKHLKTSFGVVDIDIPRDRHGEFEPQLVKKNQTTLSHDIEEKIISMYAKGMTTRDIDAHIQDIYGLEVSESTISRITDKIMPIVKEWQQRPLEKVYSVMYIDAIHYHVRCDGQIVKKAVYVSIGIKLNGEKDVLGMWVGENESAKYWATVLNQLRNRGMDDVFIISCDNLSGLSSAIQSIFPKSEIQNCIIHQIRNSTQYVSYKDLKELVQDLKAIYQAVDQDSAETALESFSNKWDAKYPQIAISWRSNWEHLTPFFKYPPELRKIIYTTNSIEGFNRQLRKVTKTRSVFPTDDSLLKLLYLAMSDITRKWSRYRNWTYIYGQLTLFFGDRMSPEE